MAMQAENSTSGVSATAPIATTNYADRQPKRVVGELIKRLIHREMVDERRQDFRYPYPFLVGLTPVDTGGAATAESPVVVVGKNLSERGLGFFHERPLPCRRAIVTLEDESGYTAGLLIDIAWCRFTSQGWYESGGRFLKVVPDHTDSSSATDAQR